MVEKYTKLLIATFIVLITASSHLAYTDLTKDSVGGDEKWYSYNAAYVLASVLKSCRSLFGDDATCGIRPPTHEYLIGVFADTGMDRYLAGEIRFDQVVNMAEGLKIEDGRYGNFFSHEIKTPLDMFFTRANLTAVTLGPSMWILGGDYAGFLLLQVVLIALASALVFELGYRLSNIFGGVLAGSMWTIHSWAQMRGKITPQIAGSILLILAMLAFAYGMRYRRGQWLLAGCVAGGIAAFYDIGLRPFVLLPIPTLLISYYLVRRFEWRLAAWPALWIGFICLFVVIAFFIRTHPLDSKPFSFSQNLVNILVGVRLRPAYYNDSFHNGDGWWETDEQPQIQLQTTLIDRLKAPLTYTQPVSFYRIWSAPWGQYTIRGMPIVLIIHQIMIVIGFAGLFLLLGSRDWRSAWGWLFFAGLAAFTFINGFFVIETRRALPWIGPLLAMGGALLGIVIVSSTRSLKSAATALGIAFIAMVIVGYLDVSLISIVLPNLPSKYLFGFVLIIQLVAMVGIFFWMARRIEPVNWRWTFMAVPLVVALVVFSLGQYSGHWRQWTLPLTDGIVAKQLITLPAQLPGSPEEIPWLLFDTSPSDRFEVRVNDQIVKTAEQPLVVWRTEGPHVYHRIWRGLMLDPDYFQPRKTLEVEIRAVSGTPPQTLYGDFPSDDPAIYVGPAIDYVGQYRSVWRASWSPINDPRGPHSFDLRGVTYRSAITLADGRTLTDDLSPAFGRQHGNFRILLGVFGPDESPPIVNYATVAGS